MIMKFKSNNGFHFSYYRDYLHSRGNHIDENDQDDYSFSSQSDDFESSSEYQKLEESQEVNKIDSQPEIEIDQVMNQSSMSKSLLHCLDGNDISLLSPHTSFERSRKRLLENDDDDGEIESSKEGSEEIITNSPSKRPLLAPDDDDIDDLTDF
jgi:hypothetical protein